VNDLTFSFSFFALATSLGVQHQVAPHPVGLLGGRLVALGGVDRPGERRRLGQGHELDRLVAEVVLGGGGDTVDPFAEVGLVQVSLQDLVLGQAAFQLDGVDGLAQLAVEGAGVAGDRELDELLGEGAPALGERPVAQVGHARPGDAPEVDPVVVVEAVVLDGDDGVADPLGDVLELDHPTVLVQPEGGQGGAVGGVDDRLLGRDGQVVLELRHVDQLVGGVPGQAARGDHQGERGHARDQGDAGDQGND
jgi:hypothetical protein